MPALMNKLPEKLVLRATRTKATVVLVAVLLFMSLIFWAMMFGGRPSRQPNMFEFVAAIGLFGFCITVCVLSLYFPSQLELHRNHFVWIGLFGKQIHNWDDVSMFHVFRDSVFERRIIFYPIAVDNKQGFARQIAWVRWKMALDTYGMEASDFANLLNSFRERAINDGK